MDAVILPVSCRDTNASVRVDIGSGSPAALAKSPCPGVSWNQTNSFVITSGGMFGASMKTRCDHCCGPFGLIRRRYFDHQFCCEVCEEAYKKQRAKIAAQFKSGFYSSISDSR
jgi:hypothetical protein